MSMSSYKVESTIERPIEFFYHFYREGGFSFYYENFAEIEFEERNAISYELVDSSKKVYDFDVTDFRNGDLKTVRVSFEAALQIFLEREVKLSVKMINDKMLKCESIAQKKAVAQTLLQSLDDLQKVLDDKLKTAKKYLSNGKALNYLTSYIHATYQNSIRKKKAKRKRHRSFGFVGDPDVLKKIFKLCNEDFRFVDVSETKEKDFVEILTTKDYSTLDKKIYFQCKTVIAVYILHLMSEKLFRNLNDKVIEESKAFVTNDGNTLTAVNYRKSKSPLHSKTVPKEDIQNLFSRISSK